jgi:hypothetical protein
MGGSNTGKFINGGRSSNTGSCRWIVHLVIVSGKVFVDSRSVLGYFLGVRLLTHSIAPTTKEAPVLTATIGPLLRK